MSTALELHGDLVVSHRDARGGIEKASKELFGVGRFKPFEVSCQVAIEGIGDQSEHHIEIHWERDRGCQGIPMKEINIFCNRIFDQHAVRVPFNQIQWFKLDSIGQKQGGFVMAQAGDRELPERPGQSP